MHELCWEPPEELSKVHTEKEIEEIKEQLLERGGLKAMDVYDFIRNKKRHIRTSAICARQITRYARNVRGSIFTHLKYHILAKPYGFAHSLIEGKVHRFSK